MRRNLVLVDSGLFCVGMEIQAGIYYRYKGAYVLLCKDVLFTKELIDKLRAVAELNGGIYIEESSYAEVWQESLRQYEVETSDYSKSYHRVRQEYNRVLSETVTLLGDHTPSHGISIQHAESISSTIAAHLEHTKPSLLLNCINMIYAADNYLYTHCVNVATLNGMIGRWMELPEAEIDRLIKIGLLHDLGKLSVPQDVLNKPGKLTAEEFACIKQHPVFSYENLKKSGETDSYVLDGVRQHHEKANGSGYPDGLKNDQVSLAARITAVSDVYDAMVSKRCYKDANTPFDVLALFKDNQFSDLDMQIVRVFLRNIVYLLVGMRVQLKSGEIGEVIFVGEHNYASPVIKIGDRILTESQGCRCLTDELF